MNIRPAWAQQIVNEADREMERDRMNGDSMKDQKFDVACVIARDDMGRWLLIQRSREANHFPLQWALPGGKPKRKKTNGKCGEVYESAVECALREFHEETAWVVDDYDPTVMYEDVTQASGFFNTDGSVKMISKRMAIVLATECHREMCRVKGDVEGLGWFEPGLALFLNPIEPARKMLLGSQALWARAIERANEVDEIEACECKRAGCTNSHCKGKCGCKRCGEEYADFLSMPEG